MSSISNKIENLVGLVESLGGGSISNSVLGIGNPLLDISCNVTDDFMTKYGITQNNAILAEDKHKPMYAEMSAMSGVEYIAGGSTLNTIRVCAWMCAGSAAYIGCIGQDEFGDILESRCQADGVTTKFMKQSAVPTGTCAVCIQSKERSLVANLSAANEYNVSHLQNEGSDLLANAKIVYSAGFHLTVSPDAMMTAGQRMLDIGGVFATNLSAPFISQFFGEPLAAVLRFCTFVFGNESEAAVYAETKSIEYENMSDLAQKIRSSIDSLVGDKLAVVITQGKDPVVIARADGTREYPVPLIDPSQIVDLNGAGDAFVGGFLSQVIQGGDDEQCVNAGNYAASYIIQRSGTSLEGSPDFRV